MSLLISAAFEDFAVIVSDGLAVNIENGSLVPMQNDCCKFWTVADGIAVGSTGSRLKNRMISKFTADLADQYRQDPLLFSLLEMTIPEAVRRLNEQYPVVERPDFPEVPRFSIAPLLVGYDRTQQRIRMIFWNDDLTTTERNAEENPIAVFGYSTVVECVLKKLSGNDLGSLSPGEVAAEVEKLIREVAGGFPQFVGGRIYTRVIMTPSFKEKLKQFNEWSVVGV